jgi:hypothetical protein
MLTVPPGTHAGDVQSVIDKARARGADLPWPRAQAAVLNAIILKKNGTKLPRKVESIHELQSLKPTLRRSALAVYAVLPETMGIDAKPFLRELARLETKDALDINERQRNARGRRIEHNPDRVWIENNGY